MKVKDVVALAAIVGVYFVGAFSGLIFNNYVFPLKMPPINVSCPTFQCPDCPSYQLSCPEPNVSVVAEVEAKQNSNYVQAAHVDGLSYFRNSSTNDFVIKADGYTMLTGSSMRPTIFTGNIALLKQYDGNNSQLEEGQIIAFNRGGDVIAHRIKGLYENYLLAQGDNLVDNEVVDYEDIKYIVIGVIYE